MSLIGISSNEIFIVDDDAGVPEARAGTSHQWPIHSPERKVSLKPLGFADWAAFIAGNLDDEVERWPRLSEQIFRVDKWSVCRG